MTRKLRMGMVGGGKGAFIGNVHRMAATLDGRIELVCGAFSSDPAKSRESAQELYRLPPECGYGSYEEMFAAEAKKPLGERIDFVSIVTPNFLHAKVAIAALKAGFPVVCDKPMTLNVAEAKKLQKVVEETGLPFCLTHNYTGYPLVKEARALVKAGKIGDVRKVVVEYPQGWLAGRLEETGQKQAAWRTDPKRAGASCCMGDIGTHAENLAEYITCLRIKELCADLTTFVAGRELEDDGNVLLRFENGAKGILYASQISIDEENALAIRVYGSKGGLEWHQEEPNTLILKLAGKPRQILRTGGGYLCAAATAGNRLPMGHPEGFLSAFANLYRNFANVLEARLAKRKAAAIDLDFPTVCDGLRGMKFIETVVKSSQAGAVWVKF